MHRYDLYVADTNVREGKGHPMTCLHRCTLEAEVAPISTLVCGALSAPRNWRFNSGKTPLPGPLTSVNMKKLIVQE